MATAKKPAAKKAEPVKKTSTAKAVSAPQKTAPVKAVAKPVAKAVQNLPQNQQ